jgi:hypothetical protein
MHRSKTQVVLAALAAALAVGSLTLRGRPGLRLVLAISCAAVIVALFALLALSVENPPENFEQPATVPEQLRTKLKLWVTTLGGNSFVEGASVWRDVSDHTDYDAGTKVSRDFSFKVVPVFKSERDGLQTRSVEATGPKSVDLGISGTDNFTLFWACTGPAVPGPLFTTFANAPSSNVGLRVSFAKDCKVIVEHTLDGVKLETAEYKLKACPAPSHIDTYCLVREGGKMRLYSNGALVGTRTVGVSDILFSNKPCLINEGGGLDTSLALLGLSQRPWAASDAQALATHVEGRRAQLTPEYKAAMDVVDAEQNRKKCAFKDTTVCTEFCPAVGDWTDFTDVVSKAAAPACRAKVKEYCAEHPDEDFCGCWRPTRKDDSSCGPVTAFFDPPVLKAPLAKEPVGGEPSLKKYFTT